MITHIKLEKCIPSTSKFYGVNYTPIDITNQLSTPFIDCERLDEVLDTSQVILYNNEQDPIKPFTRFIITITDTEDDNSTNDHYIYRFSEKDTVTNVVMGNKPIYKHTLNLIEITKILEREPVDNLCFTNYLDENYGSENEIDFESTATGSGIFYDFSIANIDYASSNRLRGPYQYIGTIINPSISMVVTARCLEQWGVVFYHTNYNVPRTSYVVIKPDGTTVNIANASSFTYDQIGTYTFKQVYHIDEVIWSWLIHYMVKDATVTITWKVKVVEQNAVLPTRYTVEEVLDRLLRVYRLRRRNIDKKRFKLDDSLRTYLGNIQAPEFAFTQSTLFDVLTQIGGFIHAIPKLIPSTMQIGSYNENGQYEGTKLDNYNNWDTITFTFLGGNDKFNEDNYSLVDGSYSNEDYATNFITNVQNATQTNYASNVSVVEPFINGFVSTRTENTNFRIDNDGAVVKLSHPIQSILQVLVVDSAGNTFDITSSVKESASYNILPSYTGNAYTTKTKNFALCYKKGDNKITALSYTTPKATFADAFTEQEAIKAILSTKTTNIPSNLKDICFQVKYIPIRNFKARHYKSIIAENEPEDLALYYNQQANAVDIESYGENMKGALMKTGNAMVAETQYFNNYGDLPKKGQISNDNYYAFAINKEIRTFTPIKATTQWSKDFNKMNDFIGVKKTVRQFEISEEESFERNADYQEFCIVSDELDVLSQAEAGSSDYRQIIYNKLDVLGFPTTKLLNQIKNKLSNTNTTYKAISYVIAETKTASLNETANQAFAPSQMTENENAPSGYVPLRVFDEDSNLVCEIYADPEGDNMVTFDSAVVNGREIPYAEITGTEGSTIYWGNYTQNDLCYHTSKSGKHIAYWELYDSQNHFIDRIDNWHTPYIEEEYRLFPVLADDFDTISKFILPVSCFPFGNSIVLFFKMDDNYSANTYSEDINSTQGIENYIQYGNNNGRFTTMSLVFGSDSPIPNGFNNANNIKANGKKLYQFNNEINENDVFIDFRDNEFDIEKDSREQISFTTQLNFISNKRYIFIGKGLAHSMPMVGNTSTNYKFVLFESKPSKFNSDVTAGTYVVQSMPTISVEENLRTIVIGSVTALTSCVGYGIIDADNRLCLYVDEPLTANSQTKPLYLQFRGNI